MKTLKTLCFALLAVAVASCSREHDTPPFTEPTYTGETNNITIADFKTKYASLASTSPVLIDSTLIIKATVVGNDVGGNIYKQVYIQDNTGGIVVSVDQNSIYTNYRVGQEIFLNLKNLYALTYGGELQVGYKGTNANRIPWTTFVEKASPNGWPDVNRFTANTVKLNALTSDMKATLVRLDSVYFANEGADAFAVSKSASAVSQTLKDANGNSIEVRTSVYATFAADTLPLGYGSVTGILSQYNGNWQFSIRSRDDIQNFTGEKAVFLDETLLTQDSFNKFTAYSVSGDQKWTLNTRYGVVMSGFASGTNNANEDWFISPAIDLSSKKEASLAFQHTSGPASAIFVGKENDFYTVWVSNDYVDGAAPSSATWTQLTGLTYGTAAWAVISDKLAIPTANLGKNFRFAFRYLSTSTQSATWQVKNVSVK